MKGLFYNFYCRAYQLVLRLISVFIPFRQPQLFEGEGSLDLLAQRIVQQNLGRALVVTDENLARLGFADRLGESLLKYGIAFCVFKDVKQNPTIENVECALDAFLRNECDCIIALGGGSPMDCAKAAAARAANPKKTVRQMAGIMRVRKKLAPLFAVPTTAGTGSETTLSAVVIDEQSNHKFSINDPALIPLCAVLEPALTQSLPPSITAATGLDALTHAIEAYIGQSNTKQTQMDAKTACRLIKQSLVTAVENGNDLAARGNMLAAAYYAGRAFTRAYVGNVHAAAHTLGGFYDVPHGVANAVLLPIVLDYYGSAAHKRLAQLASVMEIAGSTQKEKAENLIGFIKQLNERLKIPKGFDCIRHDDLPQMIKFALKEANPLYPVPKIFRYQDFLRIFALASKVPQENSSI